MSYTFMKSLINYYYSVVFFCVFFNNIILFYLFYYILFIMLLFAFYLFIYLFIYLFVTVINPCRTNPCVHGTCLNNGTTYTCRCNSGYSGYLCDRGKLIGHDKKNQKPHQRSYLIKKIKQ
jgi:hypothetical protein